MENGIKQNIWITFHNIEVEIVNSHMNCVVYDYQRPEFTFVLIEVKFFRFNWGFGKWVLLFAWTGRLWIKYIKIRDFVGKGELMDITYLDFFVIYKDLDCVNKCGYFMWLELTANVLVQLDYTETWEDSKFFVRPCSTGELSLPKNLISVLIE